MTFRTSLLAAALFTSVAALALSPASAQTAPSAPDSGTAQTQARHHARMLPGQLVDGRIAFLKAELKIASGQETQWQQVATAMRENANALDQTISTARQQRGTMDAVHRLTLREQFAKVRAENDARLLTAFKPLYASLTPEQQQIANDLVVPHHDRRHRA
jgi:Spy/CpxP family protein refolding chaperone